jgi:hypothetical protein
MHGIILITLCESMGNGDDNRLGTSCHPPGVDLGH